MADQALLEAIFQNLIPAVVKALSEELALRDEVKKDLGGLTEDFSILQAYLRDAAQKQQKSEAVRLWLNNFQDVAYDANDLLDDCALEVQRQKVIPLPQVRNSLSPVNPKRNRFLHSTSDRMKSLKERMEEIKKQRSDYGLQPEQERPHITRNESSSLEPPRILGRDDDKRKIIDLLLRPSVAGESTTSVICIAGIGGLGKTTLAQYIFNDDQVKRRFTLRSWVHVSQDFNVAKLTQNILESIGGLSQTSASLDSLQKDLLNKLSGKKYLLVLDEVWNEEGRQWHKFRIPLLQEAMGSKILVTTRSSDTAVAMGASTIYRLKPLRDKDCWDLFNYNMRLHNPNINVHDLQSFEGVIAQKCHGLPLAAVDLALRISQEPDTRRRSSILMTENLQNIDGLQADLSYQLLSNRLKQCFAFCSLFPNSFEFDKEELINLWMAQNFIQPSEDIQRMEDVGSSYFDSLERKSLFQVSRFDQRSNRSKYILHNSIHDLARSASRGQCLIAKPGQSIQKARHLSLVCQKQAETDLTKNFSFDQLRCIYTLVVFGDFITELPDNFTKKLKNLRALDLRNTILQKLPNSIDHLKHLRYLQLRGTKITTLPNELSKLYFLQTLGLGNLYMLEKLPKGIKYLQKLRHIDLHWDDDSMLMMAREDISWSKRHSLRFMPKKIGLLINLQTLSRFVVGEKRGRGLEELENLNQLHGELLISNLHLVQRVAEATKANLKDKKDLQCLELHWADVGKEALKFSPTFRRRDDVEAILHKLQPHRNLRGLRILGYMGTSFPSWLGSSYLCNLTSLTLINCRQCSSLPQLENLPLLAELHIEGMNSVRYVGVEGCALNALREFRIKNCYMLEKITHDMPSLEKLVIQTCPQLSSLPEQVGHLKSLKHLEISDCRSLRALPRSLPNTLQILILSNCPKLKERCKPGGEDWLKIKDIFSVRIDEETVSSPMSRDLTT